ncbi:MAG: 50S ribosomal protein L30 [Firmicutes bacterium]|nr:50S ribosomal protein L30 [Bacillota bacterium]
MKVRVTLVHSPIGGQEVHRATLRSLGLRRIGSSRVHEASPTLDGMLRRVRHLVRVEPAEGGQEG